MLERFKRGFALALVLILIAGLAVYAQTERRAKPVGPNAGDRQDITGIGDFLRGDPANRQEWFFKTVDLQRNLMPPGPKEMLRLAALLGLTEEQKQSLRALYTQFRDAVKPVLDQRAVATREFYGILQGTSPSKDALQTAAARVEPYDRAILDAELDFWLGFRQILNPQQQQTFSQTMPQFIQGRSGPELGGIGEKPIVQPGTKATPRR